MPRLHEQWTEKYGAEPDEKAVETIYGAFEDSLMRSLEQYAAPKPDVVETVAKLREMGLKIGSTTGYTDKMMAVVTENAAKQGYAPDAWFSPDSVDGLGRPNPYMIFANMRKFQVPSVQAVVKVGDTVSDIREAGAPVSARSACSRAGMTQAAYEALSAEKKQAALDRARQMFLEAGADDVLLNIEQLPAWMQANN